MTDDEKLRAIRELETHPGWGIVLREMEAAYSVHMSKLARDRTLNQRNVDWLQGVLYAMDILVQVPSAVRQKIETEIALRIPSEPLEEQPEE